MQPWRQWGQGSGMYERIWRCDCGAGEFVSVGYDADESPRNRIWPWMNVDLVSWPTGPFGRVKMAWKILRHGRVCHGGLL